MISLIMSLVINDDLTNNIEDIEKRMVVKNTQFYPIQKSLDMIAKKLLPRAYLVKLTIMIN